MNGDDVMDESRWQRIHDVFSQACELPRDQRSRFVERACAGDADLCDEVRSLLEAHERDEGPLDTPAMERHAPWFEVGESEATATAQDADPARAPNPSTEGEVLGGRYRLEDQLGMGAMGVVFRATDLELKRTVAVKVLAKTFPDLAAEQRFLREAEVLAALHHPNVVTIHDRVRTDQGMLFLVMECLEGASLATVLERLGEVETSSGTAAGRELEVLGEFLGPTPAPEPSWLRLVVRWTAELASGLEVAHAHSVFHRDVKPSNVFLTRDHRAVLLDFGIAARPDEGSLTATSAVIGTPWYMAPEQAVGAAPRAETDVWGLCATMYHALTRRPPFTGGLAEVLAKLQREDPTPATRLSPGLPRDVQAILDCGMERATRRRYRSMAQLGADLRAFLGHQPVSVRPLSRLARGWRRLRRSPARALAVAATATAAVLSVALVPLCSSLTNQARTARVAELYNEIPRLLAAEVDPRLSLVEPIATADRADAIAALDELLELSPGDLPHRLFRAVLHRDEGNRAAWASDLRILEQSGSAYFQALSSRYLDDPESPDTASALDDGAGEDVLCDEAEPHQIIEGDAPGRLEFVAEPPAVCPRALRPECVEDRPRRPVVIRYEHGEHVGVRGGSPGVRVPRPVGDKGIDRARHVETGADEAGGAGIHVRLADGASEGALAGHVAERSREWSPIVLRLRGRAERVRRAIGIDARPDAGGRGVGRVPDRPSLVRLEVVVEHNDARARLRRTGAGVSRDGVGHLAGERT